MPYPSVPLLFAGRKTLLLPLATRHVRRALCYAGRVFSTAGAVYMSATISAYRLAFCWAGGAGWLAADSCCLPTTCSFVHLLRSLLLLPRLGTGGRQGLPGDMCFTLLSITSRACQRTRGGKRGRDAVGLLIAAFAARPGLTAANAHRLLRRVLCVTPRRCRRTALFAAAFLSIMRAFSGQSLLAAALLRVLSGCHSLQSGLGRQAGQGDFSGGGAACAAKALLRRCAAAGGCVASQRRRGG